MKWSFLCFLLLLLNPVTLPAEEFEIEKASVIVNIHTNTLALIEANHISEIHPVATGKKGEETPVGHFHVLVKAKQPYYRKKNIQGGDKDNPLGTRWIGFDANGTEGRTFGLHGTNRPSSIGYHASLGCIRLANTSVERLYEKLEIGSAVVIVNEAKSFKVIAQNYGLIKESK
ncbi:lipoprotein-anchoring transpeptidase ErfK/SrfK [Alkalihalobacillus xiaoxiensis]|uniref:Lipoprotein-anchoring transpeptidase ErfK/SrfK n=1 Tax=Shouchella xiaoxiensis TaxID=766895 RepID=A0ABS2STM3_9BACI|nr:lipoprotein-anchoring transpeptidase ErfK/SrfK [Shouchella xiaoxiensis]